MKKKGGWAQYHRDDKRGPWEWHYIQHGTEYRVGKYFSREACVLENTKGG